MDQIVTPKFVRFGWVDDGGFGDEPPHHGESRDLMSLPHRKASIHNLDLLCRGCGVLYIIIITGTSQLSQQRLKPVTAAFSAAVVVAAGVACLLFLLLLFFECPDSTVNRC